MTLNPQQFGAYQLPFKTPWGWSDDVGVRSFREQSGESPVVMDLADRRIAVVRHPSGLVVPVYTSSGLNPKRGVSAGDWVPFAGMHPDTGWLNKFSSVINREPGEYPHLDEVMEHLRGSGSSLGTLRAPLVGGKMPEVANAVNGLVQRAYGVAPAPGPYHPHAAEVERRFLAGLR